jgi:hypothetical protein
MAAACSCVRAAKRWWRCMQRGQSSGGRWQRLRSRALQEQALLQALRLILQVLVGQVVRTVAAMAMVQQL